MITIYSNGAGWAVRTSARDFTFATYPEAVAYRDALIAARRNR